MKTKLIAVLAASILAVPGLALAQRSHTGATRAQVRAELVEFEKAGPSRGQDPYYPADVQKASGRLQIANAVVSDVASSGYGGNTGGAVQTGVHAAATHVERSIYFGH